jgi:Uma2 family endonuclease
LIIPQKFRHLQRDKRKSFKPPALANLQCRFWVLCFSIYLYKSNSERIHSTYQETMLTKPIRRKVPIPIQKASIEDYFRIEDKSIHKHEYHNGLIKKMVGGKLPHNQLAQKAATIIDGFVENNELAFIVSNSDTKIRIEQYNKFVYPDAVVICEKPEFYQNRKDTITNPLLIVEVLSDSTKEYDRTLKYEYYRTIPSFKEYVLVHQDTKHVSVYTKQTDNTWIVRDYDGDEATAILYAIQECPLSLKRLYRGLEIGI